MFRLGILIRALPAILGELVGLVWYAYQTGDRRLALAALVWLTSTVTLISLTVNAAMVTVHGGEVNLKGPFIAASVPVAMWVARELVNLILTAVGWMLSLFGTDPVDVMSGVVSND